MNKEEKTVTISEREYEQMKAQIQYLMEQLKLTKHRQFGVSSEKSEYDLDQLNLFNEAEAFAEPIAAEPALVEIEKHYRKKRRELPNRLPEDLPVEVVEHMLADEKQFCPECEGKLHAMGKETIRRELKLVPAKAVIVEHVRYTYACRNCEKTGIGVPVVKAPMPEPVIMGGFAAPESVAHIMTQKFVMGSPLYRQEQDWLRQGISLSRQTMSNWLLRCAADWLEPIYDELRKSLLTNKVLHADETTLQVLREPGRAAQSKSYMWLYRTSGDASMSIVLYEYQQSRGKEHPKSFLDGFSGYLHTDGYAAYHSLPENIVVVGCWAHARRKFDEALKSVPKQDRQNSSALIGKQYCDKLFTIEKQLSAISPEDRKQKRLEQAQPVLDEFLAWLKAQERSLVKNAFGRAVRYALDQWEYLVRYLLDGRLEISNNRAERSIKPFVIDRKNFLFANTPRGAKASAIIFSIIETAKENGLNPFDYLTFLFRELPNRTNQAIEYYLPKPAATRV
jgi:transposase